MLGAKMRPILRTSVDWAMNARGGKITLIPLSKNNGNQTINLTANDVTREIFWHPSLYFASYTNNAKGFILINVLGCMSFQIWSRSSKHRKIGHILHYIILPLVLIGSDIMILFIGHYSGSTQNIFTLEAFSEYIATVSLIDVVPGLLIALGVMVFVEVIVRLKNI